MAFTYARSSGIDVLEDFSFDYKIADYGNSFRPSLASFTSEQKALIFFELCGAVDGTNELKLTMKGMDPSLALSRKKPRSGFSANCRGGILSLSTWDSIYATARSISSDQYWATSLSAFSISDVILDGESTFFAGKTVSNALTGKIHFDDIFIRPPGTTYTSSSKGDSFRCPKSGVYFFTFTTGVNMQTAARVAIMKQSPRSNSQIAELTVTNTNLQGLNTYSKELLLQCSSDEEVYLQVIQGKLYSSDGYDISWGGFHYLPSHHSVVAWSVSATRGGFSSSMPTTLTFNKVLVLEPADMFVYSNQINVPQTGYYYVYISGGASGSSNLDMGVFLNGIKIFGVKRTTSGNGYVETLGHGMVYFLMKDDRLQVRVGSGCEYFSQTAGGQSSFMGFLLYK